MQIFINGQTEQIHPGITIEQLLEQIGMKEKRVAVEVNQEIVVRSLYIKHKLNENDKVEIVNAIGGG